MLISIPRRGITEKAQRIHNQKARTVFIVTVHLPENFLYAGFIAFTMLVITVLHTIRIRIVVVIFID